MTKRAKIEQDLKQINEALEVLPPNEFGWAESKDECLRSFIFDRIAVCDIDANVMLENMQKYEKWLRDGTVNEKPPLKLVPKNAD